MLNDISITVSVLLKSGFLLSSEDLLQLFSDLVQYLVLTAILTTTHPK